VAWGLGVAKRSLHEIAEIAAGGRTRLGSLPLREQQTFQRDMGFHTTALGAARLLAKEAYETAVEAVASGADGDAKLRETRAAASYVTEISKAAVTFAYEASGSAGMRNPSRLQRCFRDVYVGAAHQVFDSRNYNEVVKPSLGLEPSPF
jgi:alkylation response protein AidB-like acyl-CoA dehydrogenase